MEQMREFAPYLLRALYDWIVESGCTPHVTVDATHEDVQVPAHTIEDGRVTLNIAPEAIHALQMEDTHLAFNARFGGKDFSIWIPIEAIMMVYAKETGAGSVLPHSQSENQKADAEPPGTEEKDKKKDSKKPNLTVIK